MSESNATTITPPDTPESVEYLKAEADMDSDLLNESSQSICWTTTVPAPKTTNPSSWPPYDPVAQPRSHFPSDSLLAGTEPLIWQALGTTLAPQLQAYSKQVAIRQALRSIRLGWIATNTTPFRIVVGKLYDQALAIVKQKQQQKSLPAFRNKRVKYTTTEQLPSIQIDTTPVPPNSTIQGPLALPTAFTRKQRMAVWHDLETYGACVIRNAVSMHDLAAMTPTTTAKDDTRQGIKIYRLAETMGNGVAGTPPSRYFDLPKPHSACLLELETTLWNLLLEREGGDEMGDNPQFTKGGPEAPSPRKSIFLQYGAGAENWAHQDNNRQKVPIQAVLLTSQPEADFDGGEFYVAKRQQQQEQRDEPKDDGPHVLKFCRHVVSWQNTGDLVLFQAGKDTGWSHGMMPVKEVSSQTDGDSTNHNHGDRSVYARQTIGMLQPV
uniref:Fe2OG dioxygenase domain-containing protein n=1 Tax=Amphora coffeiformis TaxID=265554 RepID=A0A7S3P457_9STRA